MVKSEKEVAELSEDSNEILKSGILADCMMRPKQNDIKNILSSCVLLLLF